MLARLAYLEPRVSELGKRTHDIAQEVTREMGALEVMQRQMANQQRTNESLDNRLDTLEKWKMWVIGVAFGIGVMAGLVGANTAFVGS